MDQQTCESQSAGRGRVSADFAAAVRSSVIGLLISGGICLYFGWTLVADAPGSVSNAEAERWFAVDNATFWALRGIGVLFLVAAGLAAAGQRLSALLAALADALFALLMLVMTVEWTIEARVDGMVNYQVILLLILAVIAAGGAKRSWSLYARSGIRNETDTADFEGT